MITITNTEKNKDQYGPHEYRVQINDKVICLFTHSRELGLSRCLLDAAAAVEAMDKRDEMPDIDSMAKVVLRWFIDSPEEARLDFKRTAKDNLVMFHHSLGMSIRNEFKLWENKWEPELIDGVDCSPNHPDAISMRIIERVWEMAHEKD